MKTLWQRTKLPAVAATPVQPRMTRRSFLTITAVTGGLLAAGKAVNLTRPPRQIPVREQRLLMGTTIHLEVIAPSESAGRAAIEATFAAMQRLIALFDYRRPDSTLSTLNRDGVVHNAPGEFIALLALAQTIGAQSAGAFDVTVQPLLNARHRGAADLAPLLALVDYRRLHVDSSRIRLGTAGMAVTLDGLAKGRVIDEAVASLRSLGYEHVLVEAGGDLAGRGERMDAQPWRVGLAHPRNNNTLLTTVNLVDAALATSGDYMNYLAQDFSAHHIVDPRTGVSPSELAAVTVLAQTATEADALSTALMVLGVEQGKTLLAQRPGTEALFVTKSMEEIRTEGFPV